MKHLLKLSLLALIVFAFLLVSCGPQAPGEPDLEATVQARLTEDAASAIEEQPAVVEEAPAATAEPAAEEPPAPAQNFLMPGEPPEPERTLEDSNSSYSASEHKATQGDNFLNGLYERPFTAQEMVYQSDLDIKTVDFAYDDQFFYFTIRLYGPNNQGGGLQGMYSVELDRSFTGRGDMLVSVKGPAYEWSMDGVTVYIDKNRDVGGPQPVIADSGFNGSGYDGVMAMEGDKVAYTRVDPQDGNAVQIAVSLAMIGDAEGFAWGAWADNGLMDPSKFDYNDTMGPGEAGSPILGDDYPLKALYNLDNTCRLQTGIGSTEVVPGLCKVGAPPPEKGGTHCHCDFPRYYNNKEYCLKYQHNWVCN